MRDIELEEGEAYSLQDDDDENIDPDRDFSYLDKKIEIVLGQDQRDFLAGLTAENLGARYGGYGSFLPMQQRSPPVLSNPTPQSQCNTKSPQNPPTDRFHQNPSGVAHQSLPTRPGLPSKGPNDRSMQAPSEPGVSLTNKQLKLQGSEDGSFSDQQKKPLIHHADQSLLKFRVKMTSENVSSRDNSAIYSGLGLDMSPCSSPDDSPGTSPGMQESQEESPSSIIKIMTSCPLFNDVLLSPLDDRLISFMPMENGSGSGELGFTTQELPVNSIDGGTFSEAKRRTKEGRKSKLEAARASKDEKPKQKESRKDKKLKQKVQSMKAMDSVKANQEYPVNAFGLPTNKSEVGEISVAKAVVSKIANDVADNAAMTSNSGCFRASVVLDKKTEIGHLEEINDRSMKQDRAAKARDKSTTGESVSVPTHDVGMGGEGNVHSSRGKTDKDKNVISHPKKDSSDRRNDVRREAETNKSLKQQNVGKERAKELVLNSLFPKEDDSVHRKENVTREKIPKGAEVGFVSTKDVEGNSKHFVSQDEEAQNAETIEPLKKSFSKPVSNPLMAKKKSKESQADGMSVAEPSGGNVVSSRTKKGDMDLHKEVRKDVDSAINAYPGRKGKDGSSQDYMMGTSEREIHASSTKMKEKSTGKKIGIGSDVGSNVEGDLAGGTKAPAVGVVPAENALSIVMDDWVMCEKCEKWRLLPFGRNPDLLPKKWICKMLDWLPGMNKCSFTEQETTNALYAMYQLQVPASLVQSNQQGYPDGTRPAGPSAVGHPASLPTRTADTGGGNKMDSVRTEISAARQGSFPGHDIPVKKEQHFSEHRIPKNLKKHPRESDDVVKNGDSKSSKSARKRMAEVEASGTPKKMKMQSLEKPDPVGMLPVHVKVEGQSYNPGVLQLSEDFAKGTSETPLTKSKANTQHAVVARVSEKKDVSGRKRKLKDQLSDVRTEELSAKGTSLKKDATVHRKEKKEKKSKTPSSQPREGSIDKSKGRTHSDAGKYNIGDNNLPNNNLPNGSRMNDTPLGKHHHAESPFQRNVDGRKSSEKAHDFGLDNATTSSSSKISYKVKAKERDIKSSPVGSISSSPMKASKSDRDNSVKKGTSVSHEEPEELVASKRQAEGSSNELVAHNEETRGRKSNLSRSSRVMVDASDDDRSNKKVLSSKRPGVHTHVKPGNHACGKLDVSYEEGTSTSLHNLVSENHGVRSLDRLHFDETNSKSRKPHVSNAIIKKEPSSHSHGFPKFDKGSLRHPDPTGSVSRDVGASSSIADSFYKAAKTALQEATDLKHSANHLKKSGSGLESTRLFFQAALKFLHGASLLEPDNSESGRCGEMSPSDVYATTAKLCEYCAREYERSNDMASAALAYKCMEVAYMRVVYYNDLAACRDRMALHMAVRAAPQAESPSSSASDIDNLNNQVAIDAEKNGHSVEHRNHVISAGNRPNFMRLLDFTKDINLAMEASRRAQSAFVAANSFVLRQPGNEEPLSCIKRVLDFSFHDVDALLHLVRLAMDALNN